MKAGRQGILSLTIKDKGALYAAYMPFVKNGGLFVPTGKNYQLGDEVFMLLTLMDEGEKIPVAAGIGVQFGDQDDGTARNKIETYLAGALQAERPTHTM